MAAMTRAELEAWLAGQIAGVYHNRLHGALGASPLAAWRAAEAAGWSPRRPRDDARLLLDFLPAAQRMPCRDGLRLFNIAYWHERMAVWAAEARMGAGSPRWPVRYDPRDLSQVWLETPDGALERLACKRLDRPPITLWEHRAACAALRAEGRAAVDEEALFAAIEDGRRRVAEAEARSREARRARQRREDAHGGLGEAAAGAGEGAAEAGSESDGPVPVRIYAAEEW
jgi:putative transposase